MAVHFNVGDVLVGTVSTMDTRELKYIIQGVVKQRPITYSVKQVIDPHRTGMNLSMMGSGIQTSVRNMTEKNLKEYIIRGWMKTNNVEIQSLRDQELNKKNRPKKVKRTNVTTVDSDEEYWNYIVAHGSEEEKEKAADYFDVTPSDFDMNYRDAHR